MKLELINYMVKQYFCLNYKKWFYTVAGMFIIGLVLKYISPETFLPSGSKLILWDYVFSSLSYPLVMILIVPINYCYLVGDIITRDYEGRYIEFFLSRVPNRMTYFISKVVIILITSNLLFLCYLANLIIISCIYKLPLIGEAYYDVVIGSIKSGNSVGTTLIVQYALFIITLFTLGLFIIIISLLFNKSVYSFVGIIILVLQGHNAVFDNHSNLFFSPISQGILSLHYPFYFYGTYSELDVVMQKFTIGYSIKYLSIILLSLFVIGCLRVRNMSISRKG